MSVATKAARRLYRRWLRPRLGSTLNTQRIKLAWYVWGYWPLIFVGRLSIVERLMLLARFLRIDWSVLHGHTAFQIATITRAVAARPGAPGEVFVEAGCWNGGSSAKFSLVCRAFGYRLRVYDSFAGVEPMGDALTPGQKDFSGEYASAEETVRANVRRFGDVSVSSFHKGWFADTIAREPVPAPVAFAYIDCDTAKGTAEVLSGLSAPLTADGRIFSQDFHNPAVRELLSASTTWERFGRGTPRVTPHDWRLASLTFNTTPWA